MVRPDSNTFAVPVGKSDELANLIWFFAGVNVGVADALGLADGVAVGEAEALGVSRRCWLRARTLYRHRNAFAPNQLAALFHTGKFLIAINNSLPNACAL